MTGRQYRVKLKGYRPVPVWAESATGEWGALVTAVGILEIDGHLYPPWVPLWIRLRCERINFTRKTRATKLDTQA